MTFQELVDVMKFISANNSPIDGRPGLPVVKYANPVLDFRGNVCFSILFRGFGGEKQFYCQNEARDLKHSLKDRVMAYLSGQPPLEEIDKD